jgi:hypothetical protein
MPCTVDRAGGAMVHISDSIEKIFEQEETEITETRSTHILRFLCFLLFNK